VRFREAVIESIKQLKQHPHIGSVFRGSIPGLSVLASERIRHDSDLLPRRSGQAARG
jgi:hypothetical protein